MRHKRILRGGHPGENAGQGGLPHFFGSDAPAGQKTAEACAAEDDRFAIARGGNRELDRTCTSN